MLRRHTLIVFVALAVMAGIASPSAMAQRSPAGTYAANVGGTTLELVLHSNGTATLQGERTRWQQHGKQVVFTDSEGSSVAASYDGNHLRANVEGTQIVFTRSGASTAPTKTARAGGPSGQPAGSAFRPSKVLKGRRYRVKGANASFTLPRGWKAKVGNHNGQEGVLITRKKNSNGVIVLTAKMLSSSERQSSVGQVLAQGARELVGDTPVSIVRPPTEHSVRGYPSADLLLQGQQGGQSIRARLGGIKIDGWGAVFMALYPANDEADYQAAFDTVFSTFKGKAPKQNLRLAAKVRGCWEHYSSSTGGGSVSSSTRFWFGADGSYRYHHYTSVSVAGAGASNESKEAGSFAVFGDQISTEDARSGASGNYSVRFKGRMLYLNGTRYLPCS